MRKRTVLIILIYLIIGAIWLIMGAKWIERIDKLTPDKDLSWEYCPYSDGIKWMNGC